MQCGGWGYHSSSSCKSQTGNFKKPINKRKTKTLKVFVKNLSCFDKKTELYHAHMEKTDIPSMTCLQLQSCQSL